ncbi:unnamed protein product, partial [Prorocentrum cordatum]
VRHDKAEDEEFAAEFEEALQVPDQDPKFTPSFGEHARVGGVAYEDMVAPNHYQVLTTWGKTPKQMRLKPLSWTSRTGEKVTVYPLKETEDSWLRIRMFSEIADASQTNIMTDVSGLMDPQMGRVMAARLSDKNNEKAAFSTFRLATLSTVNEGSRQLGGNEIPLPLRSSGGSAAAAASAQPQQRGVALPLRERGRQSGASAAAASGSALALEDGSLAADADGIDGEEPDDCDLVSSDEAAAAPARPAPSPPMGSLTPCGGSRGRSSTPAAARLGRRGRQGSASQLEPSSDSKKGATSQKQVFDKRTPEYWIQQTDVASIMAGGKPGQGPNQLEALQEKCAEGKRPAIRAHLELVNAAKEVARMSAVEETSVHAHLDRLKTAVGALPASACVKVLTRAPTKHRKQLLSEPPSVEGLIKYMSMFRLWKGPAKDNDFDHRAPALMTTGAPAQEACKVFFDEVIVEFLAPLILGDAPKEETVMELARCGQQALALPEFAEIDDDCAEAIVTAQQLFSAVIALTCRTVAKNAAVDACDDIQNLDASTATGVTTVWTQVGAAIQESPRWNMPRTTVAKSIKALKEVAPLIAKDIASWESISATRALEDVPNKALALTNRLPQCIARLGGEAVEDLEASAITTSMKMTDMLMKRDFDGDASTDDSRYISSMKSFKSVAEEAFNICKSSDSLATLLKTIDDRIREFSVKLQSDDLSATFEGFIKEDFNPAKLAADLKLYQHVNKDSATLQNLAVDVWKKLVTDTAVQGVNPDAFDDIEAVAKMLVVLCDADAQGRISTNMSVIRHTVNVRKTWVRLIGNAENYSEAVDSDKTEKLWKAFQKSIVDYDTFVASQCTPEELDSLMKATGIEFHENATKFIDQAKGVKADIVVIKVSDGMVQFKKWCTRVKDESSWGEISALGAELQGIDYQPLYDGIDMLLQAQRDNDALTNQTGVQAVSTCKAKARAYGDDLDDVVIGQIDDFKTSVVSRAASMEIVAKLTDSKRIPNKVFMRTACSKVGSTLRKYEVPSYKIHPEIATRVKQAMTLQFKG